MNGFIVDSAVFVIDKLYEGRDYPRFYALETIARVPYFSFLSVLHLYESFGWWRRVDYLKVHFAETMNEYHHLLIMEAMGGADSFKDRFFCATRGRGVLLGCGFDIHGQSEDGV